MNIYVGNLPYQASEEGLREHFEAFGEVTSVRIISDRETGRSKGFGFVEMASDDEANTAMEELDGREFLGRPLKVNEAKPKTDRRDSRGGGRGGGGGRW